jgi:hypothetical protein
MEKWIVTSAVYLMKIVKWLGYSTIIHGGLLLGVIFGFNTPNRSSPVIEFKIVNVPHAAIISPSRSIITKTTATKSVSTKIGSTGKGKNISLKEMNFFGQQYNYQSANNESIDSGSSSAKTDFKNSDTYILTSTACLPIQISGSSTVRFSSVSTIS